MCVYYFVNSKKDFFFVSGALKMHGNVGDRRALEREALRNVIAQWNANRLDLFELSEPNEVNTSSTINNSKSYPQTQISQYYRNNYLFLRC